MNKDKKKKISGNEIITYSILPLIHEVDTRVD